MDDTAGRKIDRDLCNLCMQCVDVCPTGSLVCAGQSMTVEDVMQEVLRDLAFYNNSGGGVTVSGGEPLMQWEFVRELLKECKQLGLHTALDTTGEAPWQVLEQVLDYADLVLYDIKHLDPEKHLEGTSIDNQLILENARKVAQKARMWLRFPLIPGCNDSSEHVKRIGEFAAQLKVEKVSVLPYHSYGEPKYRKLGRQYPMSGMESPDDNIVQDIAKLLETYVDRVTVGN
jgi:pyruvate formate lyase activating enzyme